MLGLAHCRKSRSNSSTAQSRGSVVLLLQNSEQWSFRVARAADRVVSYAGMGMASLAVMGVPRDLREPESKTHSLPVAIPEIPAATCRPGTWAACK